MNPKISSAIESYIIITCKAVFDMVSKHSVVEFLYADFALLSFIVLTSLNNVSNNFYYIS